MFRFNTNAKRIIAVAGSATFCLAVYQANGLRQKYKHSVKLYPPSGPNSGSEKWVKKFTALRESLIDEKDDILEKTSAMLKDIKSKLSQTIKCTENKIKDKITKSLKEISLTQTAAAAKATRKVKLILLGDSLVCGVGCDNDPGDFKSKSSPPLPKILAKILSFAMQADVEWCSYGFIGATVADLRSVLLPEVKKDLISSMVDLNGTKDSDLVCNSCHSDRDNKPELYTKENVEIIVVVVCGLNDWKLLVEQFPYGPGPARYRQDLTGLIEDIKTISTDLSSKCSVFLPAMPLICGRGDPSYDLGIAPLTYFVDFVSFVWDQQKKSVALDNEVTHRVLHFRNDEVPRILMLSEISNSPLQFT
jgi:hypothetical protein